MKDVLIIGISLVTAILITVLISRKKSKSENEIPLKEAARIKCWKAFYFTLAPLCTYFGIFSAITIASNVHTGSYTRDFFEIVILLAGLAAFWSFILVEFYIQEISVNKELEGEKGKWILGVCFLLYPFMIYYWWRFFYKPYKNMLR